MSWLDWWLPEQLSTVASVSLVVISFFTSALTAAVGIGGGVVLLAIMANLMPAAAIIPVHGVVQLGSNVGRLLTLLGLTDWRMAGWFSLGSIFGALGGGQVAVSIPSGFLQLALGSFILYSAWMPVLRLPAGRKSIAFLGMGTAFLAMIVAGIAPFVFVVLKDLFEDRRALIATQTAMMTTQQILKIVIFGALGFVFADWYGLLILMITTGFMGTLTGKYFLNRVPADRVQPILKTLLTLMAARLIYMGYVGLA
ncbi:sulfite exporter TauE/SafE family protein [Saccharospirillum sp.]|uniref:sulfite exporter TauE/SafE family protein n=1 Tax=Saccharospirillum sp. TaxID=2033801 RepID=UPI00349FE4C6